MKAAIKNSVILAALVLIDQLLKFWAIGLEHSIEAGLFSIRLVKNTGASFGVLQGNNTLLIFISLMALGVIMMNVKSIGKSHELPLMLLVSGLLGNLIDRVFRGFVVDFFDLGWWPVFNLADSCIVIGVIWLCIILLSEEITEGRKKRQK